MKWLAIINPHADHHTPQQLDALAQELRSKIRADCVWTSYPNHARKLAQDSKEYDGIIAVGGDGTISEVINGLDGSVPHLGFIPTGTGNGLAGDLALNNEQRAVDALCRPRFKPIDLISVRFRCRGSWEERLLVSTSALGYVAGTAELALGPLKWCQRARYGVAAFAHAWRQTEFAARVRMDEGPWCELRLTSLAVQNTRHAGPFLLFPRARLDDGKLDVLFGRERPGAQLLEDLAILTRTFFFNMSQRKQARKLEIELRKPATLMFDGDLIADVDTLHYQVLPRRLPCCIGAAAAENSHFIGEG
jgi:diacylglycerol kinase family enzyme